MISMRKFISAAALASLMGMGAMVVTSISVPAYAQQDDEEDRRRKRQSLQVSTARVLGEVFNMVNEDPPQYNVALEDLNRLINRELPPFDLSTALELRGGIYAATENYPAALRDFVRILEVDALPFDRLKQIRYNVAQLYFVEENYSETIRFMRQYLDGGNVEDANAWYILAGAYAQLENYQSARRPAENALQYSDGTDKKYYDLLNLVYSEMGLNTERGQLLERMVQLFPNETGYWEQLIGAYSQADRQLDAFTTLEVAYKAGVITEDDKIIALAQYYSALNNPFRGAKLLEREMNAGVVDRNLRNLELLSQLWSMAREQPKAIEALTAAARLSDSGELYYRLGQSYMADEQYQNAVSNLRQALSKGGLSQRDRGDIYLLIGAALFNIDSDTQSGRNAARRAFGQAAQIPTSRSAANGWITYIQAIEDTLRAQDQVERLQAAAERERQIDRCESIIDVFELGGSVDTDTVEECQALLAEAEAEEEQENEEDDAEDSTSDEAVAEEEGSTG